MRRTAAALGLISVKLLAPIQKSRFALGCAANYGAHTSRKCRNALGSANKQIINKDDLMGGVFLKTTSSIIGSGDTISAKISKLVDFECELCAVIGKRARKVSEAQALEQFSVT